MQVATVDAHGHPAVRTVLLKDLDERGIASTPTTTPPRAANWLAHPFAAAVIALGAAGAPGPDLAAR